MRGLKPLLTMLALATLSVLGLANWHAFNDEIDLSPITPADNAGAQGLNLQPAGNDRIGALQDLKETLARPLFTSSRRPEPPVAVAAEVDPPPAATAPSADPAPQERLQLIGVMHHGAKRARALIRVENANSASWYDSGAEIAGWRLREIADDHVVVEIGGVRSTLALHPVGAAGVRKEQK
jgi:hypothetical protein